MKSYKYEDDFNVYSSAPEKYKKKKHKLLIFSLIIFLFIIIISSSFLYFYLDVIVNKPIFDDNNVFVNYASTNKNITVDNFNKYNSFDNAYTYSFYIENENLSESNYSVNVVSDRENTDIINYAIYVDDELVFRGIIDNSNYNLYSGKLKSLSNSNVSVKFWSLSCEKLIFDINVDIGNN